MTEPVQPIVNEAHLRLLMDEQSESDILDYKRELDLLGPGKGRALVELAKDVGAMSSGRGGYIGVGLDGRGRPTGLLTQQQAQVLDEANLRSKLEKYVPTGIDGGVKSSLGRNDLWHRPPHLTLISPTARERDAGVSSYPGGRRPSSSAFR